MKFEFYVDQKETIWVRNFCEIEADSEKEAIDSIKKQMMSKGYVNCEIFTTEYLYDTSYNMTYEENLKNPTTEIYYKDKMISDNTPLEVRRDEKINKILND